MAVAVSVETVKLMQVLAAEVTLPEPVEVVAN